MKIKSKVLITACLSLMMLAACGKNEKGKTTTEEVKKATATTAQVETTEAATTEKQPEKDKDGFYVVDDYVKVKGDIAYVQTEPSEASDTYRLFEKDDVVKRTGYADGWTRVLVDDYDFYIASNEVEVTKIEVPEEATVSDATETDAKSSNGKVKKIVIDPANQVEVNVDSEEIGPGSDERKQGASVGHVGVAKETKEYDLNLQYALALKEKLEEKGYEVILTRDKNEVNLSNKKRAEIANESGATAYIRIQMNYSEDPYMTGIMAVSMKKDNIYNSQLYDESHALATRLLQGISEKTDVVNHGIYETDQMTAINWSGIPVATIKLGYLSNEAEEAKLISDKYKDKLIDGLAKGIDYYFR